MLIALLFSLTLMPVSLVRADSTLGNRLLVGYWHNFDNGTGIIPLRNVSSKWDVINVAFGDTGADRATVQFTPVTGTDASFIADVSYLKSLGKKVVLSIGGQNGVVLLPDNTAKTNFTNSLISLIDKYGFNGIDIDLESGISLNGGDTDFKNPTTPQIVNLISAIRAVCDHYGPNFILSMAPETAYVQGGYTAYGNIWGAYLPIIYGLKDKLTYIHVQHYNAGSGMGMDGKNYTQGTADYEVAMADMLLHGFPVGGNTNNTFPALRQDQVLIGLPACPSAAPSGGYISPTEMKKALDYIIKGISFGGLYKLSNPSGYPNFRGLMTWSINWDAQSNYEFSTNYRAYFDALGGITTPAVPTGLTAAAAGTSQINISWNAVSGATSYDLLIDGQTVTNVTSPYAHTGLAAGSTHTYKVRAVNSAGSSTWSLQISATTSTTVTVPGVPTGLTATPAGQTQINVSWNTVSGATSYDLNIDGAVVTGVTSPYANTGLAVGTTHTYQVRAVNLAGASAWSSSISAKTDSTSSAQPWAPNTAYKAGDLVIYNGITYKCIQAHTSLIGWEPPVVPALWQPV